jgi:membrane-bound ClpP family serine protease
MRTTRGTALLTLLLLIPSIALIFANMTKGRGATESTGGVALFVAGVACPFLTMVLGAVHAQKKALRRIGVWLILLGIVFLLAVLGSAPSWAAALSLRSG